MLVHPNKRQLKVRCNVFLKSTVYGYVSPDSFPYFARPLQKTTIDSDSSKVEVVGKKLLLLPNFDQFKHGVVTTFNGSASAASRALSMTVDCFPST